MTYEITEAELDEMKLAKQAAYEVMPTVTGPEIADEDLAEMQAARSQAISTDMPDISALMPTHDDMQQMEAAKEMAANMSYDLEAESGLPQSKQGKLMDVPERRPLDEYELAGVTALGRIFDALSVGEYASANIAHHYVLGDEMSLDNMWKWSKEGWAGGMHQTDPETGELIGVKATYPELMEYMATGYGDEGLDWSPWKRKALGLALSIGFDPISYIAPVKAAGQAGVKGAGKGVATAAKAAASTALAKEVAESTTGKAVIAASKAAAETGGKVVGKAAEFGEKIAEKTLPVRKMFDPEAGLPASYYEKKYFAEKGLEYENELIKESMQDLAKGLSKEDMEKLSYFREHPEDLTSMPTELRGKLDEMGDIFDGLVHDMHEAGIIDEDMAMKYLSSDIPYMPHIYPESQKAMSQMYSGGLIPTLFEKAKKPSFTKQRVFATLDDAERLSNEFNSLSKSLTIDEFDSAMKGYGLDTNDFFPDWKVMGLEEKKKQAALLAKQYMPEKNAVIATGMRMAEQAKYIQKDKFVNDVLETFGTKVTPGKVIPEGTGLYMPKGAIRMYARDVVDAEALEKTLAGLPDMVKMEDLDELVKTMPTITKDVPVYALPESIATDLNSTVNKFQGVDEFLGAMDKPLNVWKGLATAVNLPFHLRNMYSNYWQMYTGGVDAAMLPKRLSNAADFQFASSNIGKTIGEATYDGSLMKNINLGGKNYSVEELTQVMGELGVRGKGWLGADVSQASLYNEFKSVVDKGVVKNLSPIEWGRKMGTLIEDNARVAMFMDNVDKGMTFKGAALNVKKYLFDYSELTDFEKSVMKRAMPFYTFTRKNIPLQLHTIATQPQKIANLAKVERAFAEPETEEEAGLKPEYFDKLNYVKSPFESESGNPIYMSLDLPVSEFNRMSDLKQYINGINPAKLIGELLVNRKTFPDLSQEISEGQITGISDWFVSSGLDHTIAPFYISMLPPGVQEFMADKNILDEIVDPFKTGSDEAVLGIDPYWLHAINTALPFLPRMSGMYDSPTFLKEDDPEMAKKAYLTGVGMKTVDKQAAQMYQAYGMAKQGTILEDYIAKHGEPPSKEQARILGLDQSIIDLMED